MRQRGLLPVQANADSRSTVACTAAVQHVAAWSCILLSLAMRENLTLNAAAPRDGRPRPFTSDGLVLGHELVSVVVGVGFSEHSSAYAHGSEHVFRTGTECEPYRVHTKSF